MINVDTLISARWIVPIIPYNTVLENYSLGITSGRISALLPTSDAKEQIKAKQHIDLKDHVLMPGLVNAHAHAPMNLFRGLADDLSLMDWLQQHIWPAEQAIISEQSVADGTRLAILEMIRGGTTCFAEHYFFHDTSAEVTTSMGIRCCLGTLVIQVPTAFAQDENDCLRKAEKSLTLHANKKSSPYQLTHWVIAPHSPYMVSDQGLIRCQELAEQFNIPIHIHLHESVAEINQSLERHHLRPIAHLKKLGVLNSRIVAAHMVHVNDDDLAMFAAAGAHVAHCPESNLKLANGFAPINAMLKQGINVAIGTDSAASNNDLDMFGELRTAALVAKGQSQDPTAVPAATALAMATINGAKAFGLEREIGSLEIGKQADIIAVDMNHYISEPVYNPISHLAYAINRLQVSDVWVAGNQLLKNGEFVTIDAKQIVTQAQKWIQQARPFSSQAAIPATLT